MRLVLLLALVACSSKRQDPPAPPPSPVAVIDAGAVDAATTIVLAGTVRDAAGAPAAGAHVALISEAGEIAQYVQADASGAFAFSTPAGRWGVSAHRAGAVGAFLALAPYTTNKTVAIALGKDGGVVVRGKLARTPQPGTYLRIAPFSMNDADLFAVPVRDDATFDATLPRGEQYFVFDDDGFPAGQFPRTGDHVDMLVDVPSKDPPSDEVVAYVAKHAIPLTTAEAGNGFADMDPLAPMIGKAKIVALGEATHGTREIFQMKHRFLEYLVEKHGFTVFAIEANQPECRAINDYVLHGKGDAKTALAGIYFWTWNTEEVLALIEWMRAWNTKHEKKIYFAGFDMQTSTVAYANVRAFVTRLAPERAELFEPIAVLGEASAPERIAASEAERTKVNDGLRAVRELFEKHASAWSKDRAWTDAHHDLRILEQAFAMYREVDGFGERDASMAENTRWLHEHHKARVVVWAHNGHISNRLHAFANMGSHLRAKYKRDYLNIGFVIGEGSFQAMDWTKPDRKLGEASFGPQPAHYLGAAFERTGKPMLALDLRTLPKRGPVREWFGTKRLVRELGAVYQGERASTEPIVLTDLYDAVIYIDKTTRARPVKK